MEKNEVKVTPNRIVIMRELKDGPKTWRDLRLSYYGPERAKNPASTSFMNQLEKMMVYKIIDKKEGHYELTQIGKELLENVAPESLSVAKTKAQLLFENNQTEVK